MVYSLGWGMGETERRKRPQQQPPLATETTAADNTDHEVDVLPLNNQVGGHTRLLVLSDSTVIKPLNIRELHFYQNIPEGIESFVPRYKGVMQATNTGATKLDKRYSPIFREENGRRSSVGSKRKRDDVLKFKVHRNGNATEVVKSISQKDNSNKQFDEIANRPHLRDFLMLENITSSYKRPCILDLKMGTRQHGDDATAEKRSKQIAKCAASTSAALGVRLCGMQIYHSALEPRIRKDKYWGRGLSEDGLRDALRTFFSNSAGRLKTSIVRRTLEKLDALGRAVAKQSSYRFYSCSLLIVFEGDVDEDMSTNDSGSSPPSQNPTDSSSPTNFDMSTLNDEISPQPAPPSFCPISEDTMADYDGPPEPPQRSPRADARSSSPACDSWMAYSSNSGDELSLKDRVDVRIIDFAHATFAGVSSKQHHGPDGGFLTGVDSLKRILGEILES